ncbi:MAG: DinB family protein [Ignavibacteria bacterium]|nr:DinB family protein [Ignavibacteria bacterium]
MRTNINELIAGYGDIINKSLQLFSNLKHEQINKKPSPKSWSAAECLAHLNAYADAYLKNTGRNFSKRNNNDAEKEFVPRLLPAKFIKVVGPDVKIKLKSIHVGESSRSNIDKDIVDRFIGYQNEFINILQNVSYSDLRQIKVASPFFRLLKFQLGEMLLLTLYHQQRHLNQAERAINS